MSESVPARFFIATVIIHREGYQNGRVHFARAAMGAAPLYLDGIYDDGGAV